MSDFLNGTEIDFESEPNEIITSTSSKSIRHLLINSKQNSLSPLTPKYSDDETVIKSLPKDYIQSEGDVNLKFMQKAEAKLLLNTQKEEIPECLLKQTQKETKLIDPFLDYFSQGSEDHREFTASLKGSIVKFTVFKQPAIKHILPTSLLSNFRNTKVTAKPDFVIGQSPFQQRTKIDISPKDNIPFPNRAFEIPQNQPATHNVFQFNLEHFKPVFFIDFKQPDSVQRKDDQQILAYSFEFYFAICKG